MNRTAILAITGQGDNWEDSTLAMPGFRLGQHYDFFGVKVTENAPVTGPDVIKIARKHQTVVLQHWPPPEFVKRLKDDGVERVFLWTDYDAMPPKKYWSPLQQSLWQLLLMYRLVGTQHNRFGQQMVDPYETEPGNWDEKPHCWCTNVGVTGFSQAYAQMLTDHFTKYRNIADGLWIDDLQPRPFYGTASNAPVPDERKYTYGIKDLLELLKKLMVVVTGNCASTTHLYPELAIKWDELFFAPWVSQDFFGKIAESQKQAANAGNLTQELILGMNAAPTKFLMNLEEEWDAISRFDRVGLVTARTGSWLFCPVAAQK